ncbi:MAG: deaminase [Candidatus Woesearchaeota archaeon]
MIDKLLEGYTHVQDEKSKVLLREAYRIATYSTDPNTHVGAFIEKNGILGQGVNQLSRDISLLSQEDIDYVNEHIQDRNWKNENTDHAEILAIRNAHRTYGVTSTIGALMVMPWFPCDPCAQEIEQAGITQLLVHKQLIQKTPPHWISSLQEAKNTLKGKTEVIVYTGTIGKTRHLFRGTYWNP